MSSNPGPVPHRVGGVLPADQFAPPPIERVECKDKKVFETTFSGTKDNYPGGATRDAVKGKGRFDLIPPAMLKRLAGVYERGAVNHGDRNWETGIPFSRLLNSAMRHLSQWQAGETDEDHLGQSIWNIAAIIKFEDDGRSSKDDLNDLPWAEKTIYSTNVSQTVGTRYAYRGGVTSNSNRQEDLSSG